MSIGCRSLSFGQHVLLGQSIPIYERGCLQACAWQQEQQSLLPASGCATQPAIVLHVPFSHRVIEGLQCSPNRKSLAFAAAVRHCWRCAHMRTRCLKGQKTSAGLPYCALRKGSQS